MAADPHAETVNRVIQALRDERKKKGLSEERLATMAGLSRTGVRHVESGQFRPTLYTLLKLAEALDLDFPELLRKARNSLRARRRSKSSKARLGETGEHS